jgi:hypothetical protein
MKSIFVCLIISAACSAGLRAADAPTPDPTRNEAATPASQLAAQVKEIAATPDMSDKTKAKLIASAVQVAINNAVAGITEPAEALQLATELAGAAAKAAPHFAESITHAVMSNPSIAGIDGALAAVQAAVHAAVQEANLAGRPGLGRVPAHSDFGGNNGDIIVSPSF